MVAPFRKFCSKIWVGFCLHIGKHFFLRGFILKANRKSIGSSKKRYQEFKKQPSVWEISIFYMTISGNFERFQYFNFKTDFLENKNLFQKLEYRFLVESTKIKKHPFHAKLTYLQPMLRIITRKKHRQIKPQHLQKVAIGHLGRLYIKSTLYKRFLNSPFYLS